MGETWIISDIAEAGYSLISKAVELGEEVAAYLNADAEQASRAFQYGAKRTVRLALPEKVLWESYASELAKEAQKEMPDLVLVTASKRGKTLAAYLGGLLDIPVITEIKSIEKEGETFHFTRTIYGGLAEKKVEMTGSPVIVTVAPGSFEKKEAETAANPAVATQLSTPSTPGLTVVEREKKEKTAVNLNEAKVVVGIGRGFGKKENMQYARDLAQALDGEIACSRPITEDYHWLPEEQYVGISGQVIKPDVYLAAGISGQVQHIYGVRDAKMIVAINKDENAPIFNVSDYYIIGDLSEVIPEIVRALQS
ncbi:electron transfer flavoprotein subunit alpha/FixB family protein [Sporolactobacillus sp. KGMB 08714]|uniref:electron transfer flavoprotein subunit alpha/FixB family protein n=1 Tax=Sporolactobacillus sp. KGMB 08714 TaxID=3064704 RepID=UPI002FBEC270